MVTGLPGALLAPVLSLVVGERSPAPEPALIPDQAMEEGVVRDQALNLMGVTNRTAQVSASLCW